jgi:flagellar hook protein FlgE
MADAAGVVNPNGPIGDLSVPYGQIVNPKQSTTGRSAATSRPDAATGDTFQTGITMYDSQGVEQKVFYNFTKTATANTGTSTSSTPTAPAWSPRDRGVQRGRRADHPAAPARWPRSRRRPPRTPAGPAGHRSTSPADPVRRVATPVTRRPERLRARLAAVLPARQRRHDHGRLLQRLRQPLGQLALASFNNPGGLEKAGSSLPRRRQLRRRAGRPGRRRAAAASLNSGALEMSNVDLAEEFTGLIVAQRGFQANSRVITSSDEILQDLVNLKR